MTTPVTQIYKRTEVVGRGKFGIVYKGIHRATGQIFAIKVLNLDTSEDEVKDVQQEIQFLSHLKQVPNVTRYYGSYLNGTKLWIIMDYCAGGSLRTLLKPGRIDERYIGVIVRELLVALQYIHRQNVIHRDIKAANVLISNDGRVQLCDFGVAAQLSSTSLRRNTMAGTPYWMAPEVIMEGTSYDVKADIWSLGITIYEIATGNPPYCDKEAIRAMQLITKSKPPRLEGKQHSQLLKEIIALCLDENPEERLSAEELLKTKFVKFHKNSSTSMLKELISRYLIWREKKTSRESVLMNAEDEQGESEIEVKWDFDSLNSNEYIIENDINVSSINNNNNVDGGNAQQEDYFNLDGGKDFDDGDDVFSTGYPGAMNNSAHVTLNNRTATGGGSNITYSKNTVTYNTNIGSTFKANGTLNKAPKSLLHLFEDPNEEDDGDEDATGHQVTTATDISLPRIASSIAVHSNSTNTATASNSRVTTPIVEIEIPTMEDIECMPSTQQKEEGAKTRSRANTLVHTQSAPVIETKRSLDPGLQRRPTLVNSLSTLPQIPQSPNQSAAQRHTPSSSGPSAGPGHSAPPPMMRMTPSPKREVARDVLVFPSPSKGSLVNGSPSKPNLSMKAIASPNNPSPLLQPLNSIQTSSTTSSTAASAAPPVAQNGAKPPTVGLKRNHQNLRLQMPTPTGGSFPRLLHSNSNAEEGGDENLNQFGVNVSNTSNVPMAMTPLTEKPTLTTSGDLYGSAGGNISKRRPTITQQQPPLPTQLLQPQGPPTMPLLGQRTNSTVSSSQSSVDGGSVSTVVTDPRNPIGMDLGVFMDVDGSNDKLQNEMIKMLNGLNNVLGDLEERLIALNE